MPLTAASLPASIQLWRARLGRVTCSVANCLLQMKVRVACGERRQARGPGRAGRPHGQCTGVLGGCAESNRTGTLHCRVWFPRAGLDDLTKILACALSLLPSVWVLT